MPRPHLCRRIGALPKNRRFAACPQNRRPACAEEFPLEIRLGLDCLEAIRLADYQGLGMDEAARRMGISRHTFGRLLRKGRGCVAKAICEGACLVLEGGECAYSSENQGEHEMSEAILVAVPSEAPGGLDAAPSAHFGHCAAYTVAKVENGRIEDVEIVANKGHEHGGCVQPVQELAQNGVKALLAGGMGMRPLNAMAEAGIKVYYSAGFSTVRDALEAFAAGKLPLFGSEQLCKGNCGHHH